MFQPEKDDLDVLLAESAEQIEIIADKVSKDPSYAIFCLMVKNVSPSTVDGLQTYTNISGLAGVLAEALYAEVASQIENGNLSLFTMLQEVIADLELDYGIGRVVNDEDDDTIH